MKIKRRKNYYFDHAATTPLDERVLKKMMPYLTEKFGNSSNLYELSRNTGRVTAEATETIAKILSCRPDEFVFTGSATEADNLAVFGTVRANRGKGNRVIVSRIEHKGILAACDILEKEEFEIVRLPVLKNGLIDLNALKKELNEKTILVSVTAADSETGTLQPIGEIAKVIKIFRQKNKSSLPYFHTDASQAAAHFDLNAEKLGVDLMTISAHKLGGPLGIGGLFVRRGTKIEPIIFGGGQNKLRSGTENVPGIVGFAEALRLNHAGKKSENARVKKLRDALERGIFKTIPKVVLNGHPQKRLPNFLNISILDVEGEAMLLMLDEFGIMVGTGSACNSQSLEPSAVLTALGKPYEFVHGSLRFSLGRGNTMPDVKYVLKHLPKVVKKLRAISPLELSLEQKSAMSERTAFVGGQTPQFLKKKK